MNEDIRNVTNISGQQPPDEDNLFTPVREDFMLQSRASSVMSIGNKLEEQNNRLEKFEFEVKHFLLGFINTLRLFILKVFFVFSLFVCHCLVVKDHSII